MSLEQARLSPLSSPKRPSRDNGQCSLSRAYIGLPDHAFRNGVQHGVRRQRRAPPSEPEDALQARRDAEKRKIDEYVQLCEKLYAKVRPMLPNRRGATSLSLPAWPPVADERPRSLA